MQVVSSSGARFVSGQETVATLLSETVSAETETLPVFLTR